MIPCKKDSSLLVRLLLILLAFSAIASDASVSSGGWQVSREPDPKAHVTLTSNKPAYTFGESVDLVLKIKNTSDSTIQFTQSSLFNDLNIIVHLPDGSDAPLTLEGKRKAINGSIAAGRSITDIKPGKEFTYEIPELNRLFDMTLRGEYKLTIQAPVRIDIDADNSSWKVYSSNTIKINIDPKD